MSVDGVDGVVLLFGLLMMLWNMTERSVEYDWTFTTSYGGTVMMMSDLNC